MEKTLELSDREEKIISYLKANRRINTTACAKLLETSSDTALRELLKLKSNGVIIKNGIGRVTNYALR